MLTEENILKGIMGGKAYCLKSDFLHMAEGYCNGEYRFFTPHRALYYTEDWAGQYIGYNHYGSSAVKISAKNLKWLLKVIFECSAGDFVEWPYND